VGLPVVVPGGALPQAYVRDQMRSPLLLLSKIRRSFRSSREILEDENVLPGREIAVP